ncbi:MAG: dipeptide epimerase [Oceanococcus sp.]
MSGDSAMIQVSMHAESWPCAQPFRISTRVAYNFEYVVCSVADDGLIGRGAGMPVKYLGEDISSLLAQLESVRSALQCGDMNRERLQLLLPPGAARNAVDAALWDLQAQRSGISVWQSLGVAADPVQTVFTIGLEERIQDMVDKAKAAQLPVLKIKLNADRPLERMAAIRAACPHASLLIDANQSWNMALLEQVVQPLAELDVEMIEQPLPRGEDAVLNGFQSPLPLCADESCQHLGELESLADGYRYLNIKLDKAGGLTHAWALAQAAKQRGLELMVGCMGGSSLCVAPAHVLAQMCRYVDIDGPLLLRTDQVDGLQFDGAQVSLPAARLWGRTLSPRNEKIAG